MYLYNPSLVLSTARPRSAPWRRIAVCAAALVFALLSSARADLRIRDICRVKGQEENVLQGLGLVVGLSGTGDGDLLPTTRALARMMQLMGNPQPQDAQGQPMLDGLEDAQNVALVFVTATVPEGGAQQGDRIDCTISAINAKSLAGGSLMLTPLLGPRPGDPRVYGFAQGPLTVEDADQPTTARIHRGAKVEEDFNNVFVQDDKITLVLDRRHAGFAAAQDIVETIKSQPDLRYDAGLPRDAVRAVNQHTVEVQIPEKYRDDPVLFVSLVLNQRIFSPPGPASVVVNERTGAIVIGANVEIGAVAVTHKNIVVEAGGPPVGQFTPVDPMSQTNTTKLKALVDALNAIKVPPEDIIDIIKAIESNGDLYGQLIIE